MEQKVTSVEQNQSEGRWRGQILVIGYSGQAFILFKIVTFEKTDRSEEGKQAGNRKRRSNERKHTFTLENARRQKQTQ